MSNLNTREGGRLFDSAVHEAPALPPEPRKLAFDIEPPPEQLPFLERYPDLPFLAKFCAWLIAFGLVAGFVVRAYRSI